MSQPFKGPWIESAHCCISSLQINSHFNMAVRFRLPALMREAAAEFAATFILLVSEIGFLIYGGESTSQHCIHSYI